MYRRLQDLVDELRAAVAAVDASHLRAEDAASLVSLFSEGERLCAAGRTLAAARVIQTRAWFSSGHRTPAAWLAARTQGTLGQAIASVQTAHLLTELPATREAFVAGRLSEAQACEIASAAAADPSAEASLLAPAPGQTVAALKERCREVRAAAASDEDACERIRAGRYLRHWSDRDGVVRLDARLAPDDGARLLATISSRAALLQEEARRSGQRERAEAYAADALLGLAEGAPGPKALVHVEVDEAALSRGRTLPGERCRIPGVGPIPVSAAQRLAGDGIVKMLERDGLDIRRVAHIGRTIPAHLRTALVARDPTCVVPTCDVRSRLEIDHVIPFSEGGPTALENLARLCRFHHAQKTHHGWVLSGSPGNWTWERRGPRGAGAARAGRSPPARAP